MALPNQVSDPFPRQFLTVTLHLEPFPGCGRSLSPMHNMDRN
jgi:hypothetical protein